MGIIGLLTIQPLGSPHFRKPPPLAVDKCCDKRIVVCCIRADIGEKRLWRKIFTGNKGHQKPSAYRENNVDRNLMMWKISIHKAWGQYPVESLSHRARFFPSQVALYASWLWTSDGRWAAWKNASGKSRESIRTNHLSSAINPSCLMMSSGMKNYPLYIGDWFIIIQVAGESRTKPSRIKWNETSGFCGHCVSEKHSWIMLIIDMSVPWESIGFRPDWALRWIIFFHGEISWGNHPKVNLILSE